MGKTNEVGDKNGKRKNEKEKWQHYFHSVLVLVIVLTNNHIYLLYTYKIIYFVLYEERKIKASSNLKSKFELIQNKIWNLIKFELSFIWANVCK